MDVLSGSANRPLPFVLRYIRRRPAADVAILTAVVAAVACSVGTQYGVKHLVDGLSAGPAHAGSVWLAFVFLMSMIAADNFLWRIASWTASFTFVGVTGDLRRDIFRHLTRHAPSYFSDRQPGIDGARTQAALSGEAAAHPCCDYRGLDDRVAGVGCRTLAARPGHHW